MSWPSQEQHRYASEIAIAAKLRWQEASFVPHTPLTNEGGSISDKLDEMRELIIGQTSGGILVGPKVLEEFNNLPKANT